MFFFIQIKSFGNIHHKGDGFHIPALLERWYLVSELKFEFGTKGIDIMLITVSSQIFTVHTIHI